MENLTPDKIKDKFKISLDNLKKKQNFQLLLSPTSSRTRSANSDLTFSPEELLLPAVLRETDPGPEGEAARYPSDPLQDEKVFSSIEPQFFQEDFNPTLYELQKLPEELDEVQIKGNSQNLVKQLNVVTKKAFDQILKKESDYQAELKKAFDIQSDLSSSLRICRQGRMKLLWAREEFVGSSLGILTAFRKRQQAFKLIQDLESIKTLQKTDERLQELLREEHFAEAIRVLLEYQKTISTYSHFSAINQLSNKLQDTLDMTEEQLDVALSKMCLDFNPATYEKLTKAFNLLGKTQVSMDQLHMHLSSAIHNTSWNVVYGHAVLASAQGSNFENELSKKTYPDLCSCMANSSILPCMVDLCKALWNIMYNYKQICRWHKAQAVEIEEKSQETINSQDYVSKKLENGLARIWQDVQTKARTFVTANDLSDLSIDNFLEFMDVIYKLIQLGQEFCGSRSETLQESLKSQCWSYFHSYHLSRLDELKMHIENEGWALCPVKPSFSVHKLAEFQHLKTEVAVSPRKIPTYHKRKSLPTSSTSGCYISPFDVMYEEDLGIMNEDVFVQSNGNLELSNQSSDLLSSDDEDEELRQDFVDEEATSFDRSSKRSSSGRNQVPMLTNTSLMILRLWGKYLHLMRALKPIALNVFNSMNQLIEYYSFSVKHFFTQTLSPEYLDMATPQELETVMSRIENDLIIKLAKNETSNNLSDVGEKAKIIQKSIQSLTNNSSSPSLSSSPQKNHVNSTGILHLPNTTFLQTECELLSDPDTLFGLSTRQVAVESTIFLISQFQSLKEDLKNCLSDEQQSFVDQYENETLMKLKLLRRPVYMTIAVKSIKVDVMLQLMSKVAWDIKEVRSEHSKYVDVLLRDFQIFCFRLQELRKTTWPYCNSEVRRSLWDIGIFCASRIFVEGFANAKRCSQEGRALMHLDFRQFVIKLEKLCEMKPLPYQEFVLAYIKGFYIPEMDLESWVQQHTEDYTPKQLEDLVNSVISSNSRNKKKYLNLIDRISKR